MNKTGKGWNICGKKKTNLASTNEKIRFDWMVSIFFICTTCGSLSTCKSIKV